MLEKAPSRAVWRVGGGAETGGWTVCIQGHFHMRAGTPSTQTPHCAVFCGPRELADGAGVGPEVSAAVGTRQRPPQVLPGSSPRSPRPHLTQGLSLGPAVT